MSNLLKFVGSNEEEDMKDYKNNPRFCLLPFMVLNTRPNGQVKTCSQAMNLIPLKKNSTVDNLLYSKEDFWNLKTDSIQEIWNSKFLRDFRMRKIRGEYIPACETCYQEDNLGILSKRKSVIDQFYEDNKHLVKEAHKNNGFIKGLPTWWELRLSSICNQACRMCIPQTSSRIREEFKKFERELPKSYIGQTRIAIRAYSKYGYLGDSMFFKKQLLENASNIKYIELHGGEPTIDKNLWELVSQLVVSGHSRHIHIHVHSNIHNLTLKHINLWNQFRSGWIGVSIDAYREENEYIRYGSKWTNIEDNLKLTGQLGPQWKQWVTSSVMAYNSCSMDRLIEWFYNYKEKHSLHHLNWRMDLVINPQPLRIEHIPLQLREKATERLEKYSADENVKNCITALKSKIIPPKGSFEELLKYTKLLDEKRNQSVTKIFPHLKNIFNY